MLVDNARPREALARLGSAARVPPPLAYVGEQAPGHHVAGVFGRRAVEELASAREVVSPQRSFPSADHERRDLG